MLWKRISKKDKNKALDTVWGVGKLLCTKSYGEVFMYLNKHGAPAPWPWTGRWHHCGQRAAGVRARERVG